MTEIYRKMNRFFEEEIRSDVKDILITKDKSGIISLFGKYIIKHTDDKLYKVTTSESSILFSEMQNALAYVILMNEGKLKEAQRIECLDNLLASINFDIAVHRRMMKRKTANIPFYVTQIQEKNLKKKNTVHELRSYIEMCKKLQETKFNTIKPKIKNFR